jgi:hypothetical protein
MMKALSLRQDQGAKDVWMVGPMDGRSQRACIRYL